MLRVDAVTRIDSVLVRLEAWLETMRGHGGYGGPVAHWWEQSLIYTGAGLDWRYEGIIAGYIHLWERTDDERWLAKACRAGDDLVDGQLADGHYAASAFEINPATAGTPHDVQALAAQLTHILSNDSTRESMGRLAVEAARLRYDFRRQVDAYLEWYHELESNPAESVRERSIECAVHA